jgi:hypothetical protein
MNLRQVALIAGPTLIGLLFVWFAAQTWRRWPDALIDFGTQLYIPWRINEGAVLYRDLFYFAGGPLSQYFNALLFKIFGVSFATLIWTNLLLAAALLVLVYRRFRAVADALTATLIGLGLVAGFIFAHYTTMGNYNYIAPYSHETVHGLFLSLLAIGWLAGWLTKPRLRPACLAGLAAGLVFLTKPDIFLALMVATAAALVIHWFHQSAPTAPPVDAPRRITIRSLAGFSAGLLLPSLFFYLFFLRVEDWRTSLHSVVFGWLPLLNEKVRHDPYYLRFSGLDHPGEHLQTMATHFLGGALIIAVYAILFRRLDRWPRGRWLIWLVSILPLLVGAWYFHWTGSGASLPLWCLAIIGGLGWQLRRTPGAPAVIFPLLWAVFALALTAKMGLYCRIWHYGFVLAMPAFVAAIYFFAWRLPAWLEEYCQSPAIYLRATMLPVLLIGFLCLWGASKHTYSLKGQPIGSGGDQIVTFGPGIDVGDGLKIALDWMDKNMPPQATLAVLPAGVTVNYLTRRVNPTPCLFWDPNALAVFGSEKMTTRFEATPPDYVLLVGGNHEDFGVSYFGSDPRDGAEVMQWIRAHYQPAVVIAREPLRDEQYGLEFLKFQPASVSATIPSPEHQSTP